MRFEKKRIVLADIGASTEQAFREIKKHVQVSDDIDSSDFGSNIEFPFTAYNADEPETQEEKAVRASIRSGHFSNELNQRVFAIPQQINLLMASFF